MKLLLAITGASGAIYAKKMLQILQKRAAVETDVIFSAEAKAVWCYELGETDFSELPFRTFEPTNFFAPPASGSSKYDAMVIVPCSVGTLGRITSGTSDNLIIRAADVMLKERRKLVLVLRETPYNLIHIKNMELLTLAGATIFPASPGFYHAPKTIDKLVEQHVFRVLDHVGISTDGFRWGESSDSHS